MSSAAAPGPGEEVPAARMPVLPLAVLAAAVFGAITTEVLPVGLLPVMAGEWHTDPSRIGLLVSLYAAVVVVGSIPLTAVLRRWPRRSVLAACC